MEDVLDDPFLRRFFGFAQFLQRFVDEEAKNESERLATLIRDVIVHSDLDGGGHIEMSAGVHAAFAK